MRVWIDSIENEELNPNEIICELYAEIEDDDLNWEDDKEYFFSITTLFTEEGDEVTDEEIRLWTGYKSVEDYLHNSWGGERLNDEIEAFLRGEAEREEAARTYWEELNVEIERERYY
jgi:hypothetical protein